jgi:hypothetical protein
MMLCTNGRDLEHSLSSTTITNSGLQENVTKPQEWLSREGFSVTLASIQNDNDASDDSQWTASTTPLMERKART